MLAEQGFVVIYEHVSTLQLETVASVHALHPANKDCPTCKGKGRAPMYHGLRDKECPRCGGRGWVKATGR
jgi:DnaJ-class molecular chaperone